MTSAPIRTLPQASGIGLGLTVAKHVAQRHGGELHIDSALGHGSRFALVLPASRVREQPKESHRGIADATAASN